MSFNPNHPPSATPDNVRSVVVPPASGHRWVGRALTGIAAAIVLGFLGYTAHGYWQTQVKGAQLSSITLFGKTFTMPGSGGGEPPPLATVPSGGVYPTPSTTGNVTGRGMASVRAGGGSGGAGQGQVPSELLVFPLPPTADGKPVDTGPPKALPTAEVAGSGGIARVEVGRTAQQQAEAAAALTRPADPAAECDLLRARGAELDAMLRQSHSPRVLDGLRDERKRGQARLAALRC